MTTAEGNTAAAKAAPATAKIMDSRRVWLVETCMQKFMAVNRTIQVGKKKQKAMAAPSVSCAASLNGLPVNKLTTYISKVLPPQGATFALNMLLHTFAFFVVLTVLYMTVISPMETRALASEVQQNVSQGVQATVQNLSQDPQSRAALQKSLPLLQTLLKLTPAQDQVRVAHNKAVIGMAWGIAIALGLAFLVTVCVMVGSGIQVGSTLLHVFIENAILFAILGAIEGGFFMAVASKYVPVLPSVLALNTVDTLKDNFPAVTPGTPTAPK
jgi:hypothetical protein